MEKKREYTGEEEKLLGKKIVEEKENTGEEENLLEKMREYGVKRAYAGEENNIEGKDKDRGKR